jgi:hypothetical protein
MKTIIAGGRDYYLDDEDTDKLDNLKVKITQVISGGARGADSCGEIWAKNNNIPLKIYPADWNTHGKSAGYIRNKQMAEVADACILFPGGRGTEMMFKLAKDYKLEIHDFRLKG